MNKWYDKLKEPRRFGIFMALAILLVIIPEYLSISVIIFLIISRFQYLARNSD